MKKLAANEKYTIKPLPKAQVLHFPRTDSERFFAEIQKLYNELAHPREEQPASLILYETKTTLKRLLEQHGTQQLSLPEIAPETYTGINPDTGEKENILQFLARVWETPDKPYISQGILTLPDFRRLDSRGSVALNNWKTEIKKGKKEDIPSHLRLISKSDDVSRTIESIDKSARKHILNTERIKQYRASKI